MLFTPNAYTMNTKNHKIRNIYFYGLDTNGYDILSSFDRNAESLMSFDCVRILVRFRFLARKKIKTENNIKIYIKMYIKLIRFNSVQCLLSI